MRLVHVYHSDLYLRSPVGPAGQIIEKRASTLMRVRTRNPDYLQLPGSDGVVKSTVKLHFSRECSKQKVNNKTEQHKTKQRQLSHDAYGATIPL